MTMSSSEVVIGGRRYARAPVPVHFPVSAEMPESKRHLEQRTLLYQVLKLAFADRATIGCDQFVYWDPTEPRACVAPDAFVRLGEPDHLFKSWKVWEHGAPQLAIEIVSESDERARGWDAKLERYRRLGVRELIRFDSESSERPLCIWDLVDGDLLERTAPESHAQSQVLPGFWRVVNEPALGPTLRLSQDEHGERLYPSPADRIRELEAKLSNKP
jgi:Uma2 family endonuclease